MPSQPSISATDAESAYHALERWLKARQLESWLEHLSVIWLDTDQAEVYARSGATRGVEAARVEALGSLHIPSAFGGQILAGDGQVIGAVGINITLNAREATLICALLVEFTSDPYQPDNVMLQLLIEEHFIERGITPPSIPIQTGTSARISSQAGLQSLIAGATAQGLLPGGQYGIPPLEPARLPQPAPGTSLITHVPGFGGGISLD
ncbi:hypothetical protein IPM44_02820 [bacterium]|nr:MAG: hypothetical protein IPM44_02820 [bacterium]